MVLLTEIHRKTLVLNKADYELLLNRLKETGMGFQSLMRTLLRDQICYYSDSAATQILKSKLDVTQMELMAAANELKRLRRDLKIAHQAFAELEKRYNKVTQSTRVAQKSMPVDQVETMIEVSEKEGL